jgi:hypothetical protein
MFTATINWGDGTTTSGTVAGSKGAFTVTGGHTYADAGSFPLGVTITDTANGTSLPLGGTVTAAVAPQLAGQVSLTAATEGAALPGTTPVATFTDTNTSDTASMITATINWGDGTTTSGTVAGSTGAFTVTGGHTYADEGKFPLGVTITDTANSLSLPLSGTVTAAEADDVLTGHNVGLSAYLGQAFSGTVATFTDSDTSNVASDFSARINWGDGWGSAGVITDTAGVISVYGAHVYHNPPNPRFPFFLVRVTLTDGAPGTATATTAGLVNVVPPAGAAVLNTALGSPASQGGITSASDLVWQNHANGGNGLFAASSNSALQAWHDFAGSAVIPPATDILFHNATADGSHDTSTSLANFATVDAGGLNRGHGTDALLFRDDRVGELGSGAAGSVNTGSHITDGSSADYRIVR